jgi:hypothetical protein
VKEGIFIHFKVLSQHLLGQTRRTTNESQDSELLGVVKLWF